MMQKLYIVPVQKSCNADCLFCISKTREYNKSSEILIVNKKFKDIIYKIKNTKIKKIEITGGGEPYLHPELEKIINIIKTEIPDSYIKFYTNGNILKKISGVDEVNISLVHYDSQINNYYMKNNVEVSILEKIRYFKNNYNDAKLRLSIVLLKGAIDNAEKLNKLINLTNKYIDEYVVRTLYPESNNYKDYYVDFDFEHPKVIFEKDNNVEKFNGNILWSDGFIYTNWDLRKKRYLQSYILLKPDSQHYINNIEKIILKKGFIIKEKLLLTNFSDLALNFYEEKEDSYKEKIKKHLYYTSRLFGNQGVILILERNDDLINETIKLKNNIRNKFSFTHFENGYLTVNNERFHLNMIHAPDADVELFNNDLSFIKEKLNAKKISNKEWEKIKKYRSYQI